jgi:hypothetical protein
MNRTSVAALLFLFTLLITAGLHRPVAARDTGQESDQLEQQMSPANSPYEIITIDSQNDVGSHLSLAYDASYTPYIAYYDASAGDLKLSHQSAGNCGPNNSWSCAVLDSSSSPDVGQYPSIAFRSDGAFGVAYHDAANGLNRFTSPAAGLHAEIIEHVPGSSGGTRNALVYDSADTPLVAYWRQAPGASGVTFARRVGSAGSCTPAWSCGLIWNGVAISIDRHPYSGTGIAYGSIGGHLSYAHAVTNGGNCGGGAWQCTSIDNVFVAGVSLLQARCGLLSCSTPTQIAYFDLYGQRLKLARFVGNGQGNCPQNNDWICSIIESIGQYPADRLPGLSFVLDGIIPKIVYQDFNDQPNSIVKVAYPVIGGGCGPGGSWHCRVIDDGARGPGFVSVGYSLDAAVIDGRLHVAYYEANHGDLLLAYEPAPAPPPPPPPPPVAYNVFLPFLER